MARARSLTGFPIALAAIVAVGAGWRAWLLLGARAPALDADEAIVGLMARHVLEGTARPLYYYGQTYLGALEAWCAAAVFALFGESETALRAVPLTFSLLAIALVGVLGARVASRPVGLVAALLFALPPTGLALWSIKARGGFIELVAIGTGALLAADRLFFAGGGVRTAALLGALLGLGWWVNQQIVYYALPIALLAAWRGRSHELVREWAPILLVAAGLALAALPFERPATLEGRILFGTVVAGLVLGLAGIARRIGAAGAVWTLPALVLAAALADDLPVLSGRTRLEVGVLGLALAIAVVAATRGSPGAVAAAIPAGVALAIGALSWWNPQAGVHAGVVLLAGFGVGLARVVREPRLRAFLLGGLIGGIPFWLSIAVHGSEVFAVLRGTGHAGFLTQLGGFFTTSLPMLLGARPFWGELDFAPGLSLALAATYLVCVPAFLSSLGPRAGLLGTFLLGVPLVFAASGFGWFAREPRYLLPIYSALFLVPATAAVRAVDRRRAALAVVLVGTLLSVHAGGLAMGRSRAEAGFQLTEHERVAPDHTDLIAFLREHELDRVYTDYWIGYRLAFETGEKVLFTSFEQPATERIPAYGRAVRGEDRVAYVMPPSRARLLERALAGVGIDATRAFASGYEILFDLERPASEGPVRRMELRPEMLRASTSEDELAAVVDRDPSTRWATHAPQRPGAWIEVRFPAPVDVAWLSLSSGDYRLDHPRGIEVELEGRDGTWRTVVSSATLAGLDYWLQGGRLEIDADGERARAVRFVQTGETTVFDWSVAELAVWREDRP